MLKGSVSRRDAKLGEDAKSKLILSSNRAGEHLQILPCDLLRAMPSQMRLRMIAILIKLIRSRQHIRERARQRLNAAIRKRYPARPDRISKAAALRAHHHTPTRDPFQRDDAEGLLPSRRRHQDPVRVQHSSQLVVKLRSGKHDLRFKSKLPRLLPEIFFFRTLAYHGETGSETLPLQFRKRVEQQINTLRRNQAPEKDQVLVAGNVGHQSKHIFAIGVWNHPRRSHHVSRDRVADRNRGGKLSAKVFEIILPAKARVRSLVPRVMRDDPGLMREQQ